MTRLAITSALLLALGLAGDATATARPGGPQRAQTLDVYNEVEGSTAILYLKPEGSRATKGELLCELDTSVLRDKLDLQRVRNGDSLADLEAASQREETAEFALKEWEEGIFPQTVRELEGAITLAQAERQLAEARRAAAGAGTIAAQEAEVAALKARLDLEGATRRLAILKQFTHPKRLGELRAEAVKVRSDLRAQQTRHSLGGQVEEKLRRQIEKCKLYAPADGIVLYPASRGAGVPAAPIIEEGATVRERQMVFRIVPDGNATGGEPPK